MKPSNYKNIIGQKFGRLTALEEKCEIIKGYYRYKIKCKCDCGNIKEVEKSKLISGNISSCRCYQKECASKLHKKQFGEAAFNECYGAYKKSAKIRNYSFELTKEQFKEIVVQPCIYCGKELTQEKRSKSSNGTFKYTGIDRYDNTKGYTLENSVPCCKVCNRIKTNMTIENLENQLTLIMSRKDIWKRTA